MHFALVGGMRDRTPVRGDDLDAVDTIAAFDGASGSAHHVAVHEPLPVLGEDASPERCEAVRSTVEAASDLLDAVLGDGGVGSDTQRVLLSHEQGQLVGDISEVQVVGGSRQQHDFGVVVLDESLDLLVVLALAVAEIVRLVDDDSAVTAPQLRQPLGRHRQLDHLMAEVVGVAVSLPHGFEVLGAHDEHAAAVSVLAQPGDSHSDKGLAQSDHVSDHHPAEPVERSGRELRGNGLMLQQRRPQIGRQAIGDEPVAGLLREVVGHLQIHQIRLRR